ncbi:epimerase family protein SDR39U1-like [Helicoverpa armigera]|uniref:epimerase family protein SDR39U1-like n=1 Tax=Helicoverpa armigera TaxID=29058 RepID=UPI003082D5A6
MAGRKIIIGGGTGFIGSHLGELLTSKGYSVLNVARKPATNNISWSVLEQSGLPKACAVVNCAGQQFMDFTKSWTPGFKQNVKNSRVYTTKALAKAINESKDKPKVYVVLTGVGAYEPSTSNIYDECSPTTGHDFFSRLTVEWEKAAQVDEPVRLVIVRCGAVLGRWGGMIKNMFLPFYLGLGGRIGSGTQYLPWIHIDDLARLILFSIENENVKGVLNGVAPQVITNDDFTKSFARALRRPAFFPVPEVILNMVLHEERAMIMTKGQHVVPKRVLEYGFEYKYADIDEACKEFAHLCPPKKQPLK